MTSLFESCMGDAATQEGGGVAQLASALAPVLEQFRDGLTNLGQSVLKKLKSQTGRGAPKKKPAAKSGGAKANKGRSGKNQTGSGKIQKKPKKPAKTQKGRGAAAPSKKKKQPSKKPTASKRKANF